MAIVERQTTVLQNQLSNPKTFLHLYWQLFEMVSFNTSWADAGSTKTARTAVVEKEGILHMVEDQMSTNT